MTTSSWCQKQNFRSSITQDVTQKHRCHLADKISQTVVQNMSILVLALVAVVVVRAYCIPLSNHGRQCSVHCSSNLQ
jgi:hypothetical protein